jgi:hypothetical protein
VLLDQRAELLNLMHVMKDRPVSRDTVNLVQTPTFHATSMSSITGGPALDTIILPMFEPEAVIAAIGAYGVTDAVMVPTMIGLTMAHPDFRSGRLGSLREPVYGASPMLRDRPSGCSSGTPTPISGRATA